MREYFLFFWGFFLAKQEKYHAHKAVQNHKLLILHCDLWEIKNKAKHINKWGDSIQLLLSYTGCFIQFLAFVTSAVKLM